jgi:hypothetical protein
VPADEEVTVTGFLPSTHGFRFSNSAWPQAPLEQIELPFGRRIALGDASNGLCGGMTFAARDHAVSGRSIPDLGVAPGDGPLYDYVVGRLLDSFHLPGGVARYFDWMNRGDTDPALARFGLGRRGVRWLTVVEELPEILDEIDHTGLSCLGLVVARGADPVALGQNHQVLAYGYRHHGRHVAVEVYDPNDPGDDTIALHVRTDRTGRALPVGYDGSHGMEVRGFFRVEYSPKAPPVLDR